VWYAVGFDSWEGIGGMIRSGFEVLELYEIIEFIVIFCLLSGYMFVGYHSVNYSKSVLSMPNKQCIVQAHKVTHVKSSKSCSQTA
jgi:hypothetical protein